MACLHAPDRIGERVERRGIVPFARRGELVDGLDHGFAAPHPCERVRGLSQASVLALERLFAERRGDHAQQAPAELEALARGMDARTRKRR